MVQIGLKKWMKILIHERLKHLAFVPERRLRQPCSSHVRTADSLYLLHWGEFGLGEKLHDMIMRRRGWDAEKKESESGTESCRVVSFSSFLIPHQSLIWSRWGSANTPSHPCWHCSQCKILWTEVRRQISHTHSHMTDCRGPETQFWKCKGLFIRNILSGKLTRLLRHLFSLPGSEQFCPWRRRRREAAAHSEGGACWRSPWSPSLLSLSWSNGLTGSPHGNPAHPERKTERTNVTNFCFAHVQHT